MNAKQSVFVDESFDFEGLDDKKEMSSDESDMEDPTKPKKKDLFEGIECEISIYLFRKHNLIRWFLWIVTKSKLFENFIVVVIVFSSCKLVMDTYYLSEDESNIVVYISSIFDIVFNVIFLIEFLSKTIALGFI